MNPQPERQLTDGAISVSRPTDHTIAITVTTAGVTASIAMGEFNAWRVFGSLALMLGIDLPVAIARRIKL